MGQATCFANDDPCSRVRIRPDAAVCVSTYPCGLDGMIVELASCDDVAIVLNNRCDGSEGAGSTDRLSAVLRSKRRSSGSLRIFDEPTGPTKLEYSSLNRSVLV